MLQTRSNLRVPPWLCCRIEEVRHNADEFVTVQCAPDADTFARNFVSPDPEILPIQYPTPTINV